mmetsp:Transcript_114101/g.327813  ORF Transcript_114101/g.327813 Transcript_114101/m.327813 type:complete len:202 (+) Transcript_114101:374-979(+)
MSWSASSSSNSSFSFADIAQRGFAVAEAPGFAAAEAPGRLLGASAAFFAAATACAAAFSRAALSRSAWSLSSLIWRTASRCFSTVARMRCFRSSAVFSSSSTCSRSPRICSCNSRSHRTCCRKAALGPRFFTPLSAAMASSERLLGGRPSCSPCVAEIIDLKGVGPSPPPGSLEPPSSEGRLHNITPLKLPRPADMAPPPP